MNARARTIALICGAGIAITVAIVNYYATTQALIGPPVTEDAVVPMQVYLNRAYGFSISAPDDFSIDEKYRYQELGPGKDISGVKFTIPQSAATGTNLNSDSYISVEEITNALACTANLFLEAVTVRTIVDGDTTYSVGSSTDAAAGNRYEETVYALPGTNHCFAVRYFIHYGVIENYPAGAVREFVRGALLAQFDAIRRTLRLDP
jgi:hypothetical protein